MSKVYLTSDWHIGHVNISKYRERFKTNEEHDAHVIEQYMNTITKRDIVYFLGDICFNRASLGVIKSLPGEKRLVMGNHENQYKEFRQEELHEVFKKIYGLHKYKGCWLSHCPIHPEELRGGFNITGHTHNHVIDDSRYANVCLENTDYKPVEFREVKEAMEQGQIYGVLGAQKKPHFEGLPEEGWATGRTTDLAQGGKL